MDIPQSGGEVLPPSVKFGTDGIRGEAGTEITPDLAVRFGKATATTIGADLVVVGRDTRESGYDLACHVMDGVRRAGVAVVDAGVLPTPGVAFVAQKLEGAAAVVTASHNPYTDNGLKAFAPDGGKLNAATTAAMERSINAPRVLSEATEKGRAIAISPEVLRQGYEEYLVASVEIGLLVGRRVVVDSASGAAFAVAGSVLNKLGCEVVQADAKPNGRNINEGCGATHPEYTAAKVLESGADFGITLDGDADRTMLVSESGRIIDGDRIMLIMAMAAVQEARQRGEEPNVTVVGTIMSNMGLEVALQQMGVRFLRADVGDTNVSRMMEAEGAKIGGEQSGHIILADYAKTGDGMLAALQTMQVLNRLGMTLDQAAELMEDYPQVLLKTKVAPALKATVVQDQAVQTGITEFEKDLASRGVKGRVNVRPSGTEPVVRVMAEVEPGHDELARRAASHLLELVARAGQHTL